MLKQMENNMNDRPYIDLRNRADDELAFIVNNTEELYNLRNDPQALMAILSDDYKFTWWQVFKVMRLNLEEL